MCFHIQKTHDAAGNHGADCLFGVESHMLCIDDILELLEIGEITV